MSRKIDPETAGMRSVKCLSTMKRFRSQGSMWRTPPTEDESSGGSMTDRKVAMFHATRTGVTMTQPMEIKPIISGRLDANRSPMKNARIDYDQVFHTHSAACAILDRDFRLVEMNNAYLATLNATREALLGKRVLDGFPEVEEHQQPLIVAFVKALAGEQSSLEEILYAIPDDDTEDGMRNIWWNAHFSPLPDAGGEVTHVLLRVSDITDQVKSREMKDAIAGEMQHRIGNLLNMVTTIARQTARGQTSLDQFMPDFEARIQSLVKTHALLTGGNWDGMTMDQLIHQQLDAYADKLNNTIFVEGPDLRVTAAEAQSISMALHELATNAAKHGALTQDGGRLTISWARLGDGFEFEWNETGLVGVTEPTKSGFGTMILTRILPNQLNGKATREFTKDGYSYRLRVHERASASIVS